MNFKRCLFLRVVVEHVWHGSEVVANALAQWYFDLLTFSYFTRNAVGLHFRGHERGPYRAGSFLLFKKTEVDTACKLFFYQVTSGYRENCVSWKDYRWKMITACIRGSSREKYTFFVFILALVKLCFKNIFKDRKKSKISGLMNFKWRISSTQAGT